MGKRITVQRRGKGTSVYKARSHRYLCDLKYRRYDKGERESAVSGVVQEIVHDPARTAPVLDVKFESGEKSFLLAAEGVKVGDRISYGVAAELIIGNVLPLSQIPEGNPVYNIENRPGDGGKFVRASGTYALVVAHEGDKTVIQLPSGTLKYIDSRCRATLGTVAGGGRKDKPILKAGKMWHMLKSKAKYWPIVRKVKMNPVAHPYGGGSGHPGGPTSVSRNAPPGQKVGLIAPRRTGRR